MCLFMGVLGLHCCMKAFSSRGEWGLLSAVGAWASRCGGFLVVEHGLDLLASRHVGSLQIKD